MRTAITIQWSGSNPSILYSSTSFEVQKAAAKQLAKTIANSGGSVSIQVFDPWFSQEYNAANHVVTVR